MKCLGKASDVTRPDNVMMTSEIEWVLHHALNILRDSKYNGLGLDTIREWNTTTSTNTHNKARSGYIAKGRSRKRCIIK